MADVDLSGRGWRAPSGGGARGTAPDEPPERRRAWGGRVDVFGEARAVQSRQPTSWATGRQTQVVDFRVDRFQGGDLVERTLVEMRGRIRGALHEGDRVGLRGRSRDGVVRARKVTTYDRAWRPVSEVRASWPVPPWQVAVLVPFAVAFAVLAIIVVLKLIHPDPAPPPMPIPPPTATAPTPRPSPTLTPMPTTTPRPTTTATTTATTTPAVEISCAPTGPSADVSVVVSQEVHWVNAADAAMDLNFPDAPAGWSGTQRLEPGEGFSFAFTEAGAGRYKFACSFPDSGVGVAGFVTVTG